MICGRPFPSHTWRARGEVKEVHLVVEVPDERTDSEGWQLKEGRFWFSMGINVVIRAAFSGMEHSVPLSIQTRMGDIYTGTLLEGLQCLEKIRSYDP